MLRGFYAAIQQVLNWIVRGNCAPLIFQLLCKSDISFGLIFTLSLQERVRFPSCPAANICGQMPVLLQLGPLANSTVVPDAATQSGAAFSAARRLFDLNSEGKTARAKNSSAIIAR